MNRIMETPIYDMYANNNFMIQQTAVDAILKLIYDPEEIEPIEAILAEYMWS